MKKHAGWAVLLVIGIVLGVAIGVRLGQRPPVELPSVDAVDLVTAEPPAPAALSEQEQTAVQAYRLHQQELDSGETYSTGSINSAQEALEQLVEEYDRQAQASPGQETPAMAMGKAMAHARLSRISLAQGDPMEYERHLAIALELSGEPDEDSLYQQVDQLDQAQKQLLPAP